MKVELKGEEPVLRPHGPWSEHHPNGRVKTQGEFIDGNPAGAWRTFREDGSLAREVRYRDGKLDGEEVVWHGNGVVGMRGTWKDGAREGLFTYWDEEGSLVREEELKGGEISAPIRLFDPKGEFPPEAEALAKAAVDGKYRNLLRKIAAPDDKGSYGDFRDYGYWRGSSYLGHADLGEGHWVYVYPYWYVWAEKVE
jgi:antitoxin component YwqK of YwqJK toxin-antitoxin module